ncbi:MAG: hypothetical protein ACR2JC_20860 [Chloroflexota bacterium]
MAGESEVTADVIVEMNAIGCGMGTCLDRRIWWLGDWSATERPADMADSSRIGTAVTANAFQGSSGV